MDEDQEAKSDPFEIKFPLPEHVDPSLCRDEFLKNIKEEHELRVSMMQRLTVRKSSASAHFEETEVEEIEKEAEAMVVQELAKQRTRTTRKKTMEEVKESIRMRSNMMEELNLECQKAAIEFLSVRLLKQLRLFSSPWPGKLDEIPYNLFSWSLDHFLVRLNNNQLYLDVINRERDTKDLDCLKFRADLNEIEQIIYEIRGDFKNDKNLCENSIQLLRDCRYTTEGTWIKGLQENNRVKEKLIHKSIIEDSSICMLSKRQTNIMDRFEDVSAIDPIEVRYQINWVNSCMDQKLMFLNEREEMLMKELQDEEDKLSLDMVVQRNSEIVYANEVNKLRESAKEWQEKFDRDLETAEVMCMIASLALQKVKDDHKLHLEQEQMYRQRIDEVKQIMAAEEKIRETKKIKTTTAIDVEAAVKAIEAVYKPKEPKKKSAKF
ncbi:uncharacterized protein LOC108105712 [Drosophila eugracilis]|uniref:uncharacterized protein LOC108105712 n=1 Tax=Drosophila eugracilis TaxID=29029 RepID=UPI0007E6F3AF|nr:uncharacterized protein LOC108105712 [Drosophila eugracilis]